MCIIQNCRSLAVKKWVRFTYGSSQLAECTSRIEVKLAEIVRLDQTDLPVGCHPLVIDLTGDDAETKHESKRARR